MFQLDQGKGLREILWFKPVNREALHFCFVMPPLLLEYFIIVLEISKSH